MTKGRIEIVDCPGSEMKPYVHRPSSIPRCNKCMRIIKLRSNGLPFKHKWRKFIPESYREDEKL